MSQEPTIAFFGTPQLAVTVLDELADHGIVPSLIITSPDKPAGRKLKVTSPAVKLWADEHDVPALQPEKVDQDFIDELNQQDWDLFVVFAYGKMLPTEMLDIPEHGTINLHPSLLPKLRGPSPIRSAILEDEKTTGVTVMQIDDEMDHGSIIAQATVTPEPWPPNATELENALMHVGGQLLAETIPQWLNSEITPEEQDHDEATYCQLFKKEDGEINLNDDPYQNLLKVRAFEGWPGTYFFTEKNDKKLRVKIIDAHLENDELILDTVVPEGKSEMSYEEFLKM